MRSVANLFMAKISVPFLNEKKNVADIIIILYIILKYKMFSNFINILLCGINYYIFII